MTDFDKELENALQVCNNLSRDARAAGDLPTMYAANRAWHQLDKARGDRAKRTAAVTNGTREGAT